MEYTNIELLSYLYIYSFLGWIFETFIVILKQKHFCNRGFFNLPICLSYGVIFTVLITVFPTLENNYLLQFLFTAIVVSVIEFLAGAMSKNILHKTLWQYERNSLFGIEKKGLLFTILVTSIVFTAMCLIQPLIYIFVNIIPDKLVNIICLIFTLLVIIDFMLILSASNHKQLEKKSKTYRQLVHLVKLRKLKERVGNTVSSHIWNRLENAYPNMDKSSNALKASDIFAKDLCFDKLVWLFLICALGGDIVETIFCRITAGVWMSRSSVLYGPFSIVWGLGATLLTVILHRLSEKEDRYIFAAGCILGGAYEYICSVFTEVFFGTVFWDYSHMKFNLGGRINLLYCLFWGIAAVIWMKIIYPRISKTIEKIPPIKGKILTWIFVILFICNMLISAAAMSRYVDRRSGSKAQNSIEEFIDYHYDDNFIEKIWPNMKIRN